MRKHNQQIYLKKDKRYIPYTPTNGWDDDEVFSNGNGIYLIKINPELTMERCVIKLYDTKELNEIYKNKIVVTKEQLKTIIES